MRGPGHGTMTRARLIVLGSAAGGGYPQWNCRCGVCALYWQGDARVESRTQSSIAVTGDGRNWTLFNCSPDVRQQILATPSLHPQRDKRHSPICAAMLTNGDIDHTAGLLSLREMQPFALYGTQAVLEAVDENRMFSALNPDIVPRHRVGLGEHITLPGGLDVELFTVPGKVPLYLEGDKVDVDAETDTTIGLKISHGARSLFYIPGCARLTPGLRQRLGGSDLLVFDGTLWRDDEMIAAGVGEKTGLRMGHMSMSGPEGSLAAFAGLGIARKVYIHINNTNPALVAGSPERRDAEAAGWEIAHDGMEIKL